MKKQNILIDCDPGIDDALAVLLALSEKSFSVRAITTESGNVDVDQTTKNLVDILGLSGIKKLPKVGKGSRAPLSGNRPEARSVHGRNGLGEANLNLPKNPDIIIENAVRLIVSEVISGGVDTVIATAPLTNLANALNKEPGLARYIKKLYIMGGALRVPGNVTEFAEFNLFCDPQAAKIVLDAGLPVTLVSLDVTQRAVLKRGDLAGFNNINSALSGFIQHIANYSIDYHRKNRAAEGAYIHDPLTVGLAIDEGLGEYEDLCIDILTDGEERGRIFIRDGTANVRFCNNINSKGFLDLFLNRLKKIAKLSLRNNL